VSRRRLENLRVLLECCAHTNNRLATEHNSPELRHRAEAFATAALWLREDLGLLQPNPPHTTAEKVLEA
jgi:hypothetical protein